MSRTPAKAAPWGPPPGLSEHETEMWLRNNPPPNPPPRPPNPRDAGAYIRDPVTGELHPDPAEAAPEAAPPADAKKEAE